MVEVPRARGSFSATKGAGPNDGGRDPKRFEQMGDVFEAFVGNVSYDSTEDDLTRFFEKCGSLIKVKLLKGKAFAKFRT